MAFNKPNLSQKYILMVKGISFIYTFRPKFGRKNLPKCKKTTAFIYF